MTHIVPAVPPEFNGLGDYTRQLWRNWPEPTPDLWVAALKVPTGAEQAWPGPRIRQLEPQRESLRRTLKESEATVVALHYVGYGYSPNGLPWWMADALVRWKQESGGRLVTFFHELWATGPPWRKSFWTALPSRALAIRIQRHSDDWATSCHRYMKLLRSVEKRPGLGHQIPIGPNIVPIQEAPLRPWPLDSAEPIRALLFGAPRTRLLALRDHWSLLRHWGSTAVLESVHLVGRSPDSQVGQNIRWLLKEIEVRTVVERYDMDEKGCSEAITAANVALIHNRWEILHKSGVYAASVAHGLCCVVPHCKVPEDAPVWVASPRGDYLSKSVKPTTDLRDQERRDLGWDAIAKKWSSIV